MTAGSLPAVGFSQKIKSNQEGETMIKGYIERLETGYNVNLEWWGYGNANIIEAFAMDGIDIKRIMDRMKVGERITF